MPFFYGWLIVAIAMIAGFISSGVSNVTMAVVLKPISEDLGWSRTVTAAAITENPDDLAEIIAVRRGVDLARTVSMKMELPGRLRAAR